METQIRGRQVPTNIYEGRDIVSRCKEISELSFRRNREDIYVLHVGGILLKLHFGDLWEDMVTHWSEIIRYWS